MAAERFWGFGRNERTNKEINLTAIKQYFNITS